MTNNTNDAGSENESIDDSSVNVLHFHASNLYHSSKFLEASDLFADLLGKVPPNNFQLRREISEGLSRSLMKSGKFSEAIEAANEYVIFFYNTYLYIFIITTYLFLYSLVIVI